ncbi:MAG: acetate--CoA ligase family protein [Bacteroidetes bacterium]|jgi:acyl-CoA synthetase (NDP forming)|nr:acetate--CoA ligase family protein [Bacteroidota bacterium]
MINSALTHPESIVVVGASNDIQKPGGKVLKNIIDGGFKGKLFVMNPKESSIQGIKSFASNKEMPAVDLAVIAIAAKYIPDLVDALIAENNTRAFIILSAGFSEESEAGKQLETRIVASINQVNGALIGPNCVGILTPHHHSIFTQPIPRLDANGCDFISGSGATACFIMEAGIPNGLSFAHVYSVGNSAQMGVEEVLQYMDETFDSEKDSKVKLLYIETISNPQKLLRHARSLIRKGCKIAAIKAGSSEAGSRAASSHTGALASSDTAVEALFGKAGIVRCSSREELITVASVFMHPEMQGKRIAIITHAGGPAVMLTDALSDGGLEVPAISGKEADVLKEKLFPGSSVNNPIDFLATGTAEQLGTIIEACDKEFDMIDAMIVIFGTPGLFEIFDVYEVLHEKMNSISKPLFPVLPSTLTAAREVDYFLSQGRINFPDEVNLGRALAKVYRTKKPAQSAEKIADIDTKTIRKIIDGAESGYLKPELVSQLLDAAGIARAGEAVAKTQTEALAAAAELGFPLVMKVIGPVHKSDVGGVALNINSEAAVIAEFDRMINIKDTTSILMQPMLKGTELFAGATKEGNFGHLIFFGLGGIFIEVLKDVASALAPLSAEEAKDMVQSIKSYPIIKGVRGQEGIHEEKLRDILVRLSALLTVAPEIAEMDMNPLLGNAKTVVAVDARIRIEK